MNNIVWSAEYSSCVYESDFTVLALYINKSGAEAHIKKYIKKISNEYKDGIIPSFVGWRIKKRYVRFSAPRKV